MPGARRQPAGRRPIRRDLAGRGVGAIFANSRTEMFGSGAAVSLFNNPLQVIAPKHGYARKFATNQYARFTPRAGAIDLTADFVVVVAFVADVTGTARIIHYSDTKNALNLQVLFLTNRLQMAVGTGSSEYAKVTSSANLDAGVPYVAAFERKAGVYTMYLDGVQQADGGTGGIANNVLSADIQIARRGDGASYFSGQVSLFAHIKGQLDARSLSLNPWQLFEDDDDELMRTSSEPAPAGLIGADALQGNTGPVGAVGQVQVMGESDGAQMNTGTASPIAIVQNLSGAVGGQSNSGTAVGITQEQGLAGSDSIQSNAGDSGTVETILTGELAGQSGIQINDGANASISQVQQLVGADGAQPNTATAVQLDQALGLIGSHAYQGNSGNSGMIVLTGLGDLASADGEQNNAGSTAAIGQRVQLSGADGTQANTGMVGALARQGLALIYSDPGEQRVHVAAGEQRFWPAAGEQRILTIH